MSKRTFSFVSGVIGGAATIACATVTFFAPAHATAIVASIGIAATAATEICAQFVDPTKDTKKVE